MTLLKMYAITAIVLALKMSLIAVAQGRGRLKAGVFVNPEDAKTFHAKEGAEDAPDVQRAARAWRNDLENIPMFLILAWIYVAAGLSVSAFVIYCVVFIIARIVHTICYLNSIQPMRTISFTIGSIATVALIVHLIIGVVLA
ncbi:MAG TPA: MAPEG family protein [Candidatus Binataceae bacterium]|nr:MAPEG family protein [Candidatus Binataceae bacterium]